jgi:hypothetical protein
MQRYQREADVHCAIAGDEAFFAPLHLVTRRDTASPAALRFVQALPVFVSSGENGTETADAAQHCP